MFNDYTMVEFVEKVFVRPSPYAYFALEVLIEELAKKYLYPLENPNLMNAAELQEFQSKYKIHLHEGFEDDKQYCHKFLFNRRDKSVVFGGVIEWGGDEGFVVRVMNSEEMIEWSDKIRHQELINAMIDGGIVLQNWIKDE